MRLAIMQPYFFPYIGYFQLINTVDKFIFYDDVNFIKNGWINRNRIIINNTSKYITIQLRNASSNKLINDVEFTDNRNKLKNSIQMAYKKAPYFNMVWPLIEEILSLNVQKISEQAIYSVRRVSQYLDIDTDFEISSEEYGDTKSLDRTGRLIKICQMNGAREYINPIGGRDLYKKESFKAEEIELYFLKTFYAKYQQSENEFAPALSIIDVLMFNSFERIREMLEDYELE